MTGGRSHFGTGTEDYYGYGWTDPTLFSRPYHAQTRADGPVNFGHTSLNRLHVLDAIPFQRRLRFDMEVSHWDIREPFDMAMGTVPFFYARPGATHNVPMPDAASVQIPALPATPPL